MKVENLTTPAEDGHLIHLRHWHTPQPQLIVQLCHGMAEHCARYDGLGSFLTSHNIAMLGADHRGFGHSRVDNGIHGHFADLNGWQKVSNDQLLVYKKACELYPDTPVVLFGHSMGGYIAQQFSITYGNKLAGLILSGISLNSSPLLYFGLLNCRIEKFRLGPHGRSHWLDKLSFGSFNNAFKPVRTDFDWLSRDSSEVDKYINDPRCGDMSSNQLWEDFLGGLLNVSQARQIEKIPTALPVLIFGGSQDPAGGKRGLTRLQRLYKKTGHGDSKLKIYKEGRHEMLNEINREEVLQDILTWLKGIIDGN